MGLKFIIHDGKLGVRLLVGDFVVISQDMPDDKVNAVSITHDDMDRICDTWASVRAGQSVIGSLSACQVEREVRRVYAAMSADRIENSTEVELREFLIQRSVEDA